MGMQYGNFGSGSGGGGVATADNGLTVNPAGNVQLGGQLIQATTIDTNGQTLTIADFLNFMMEALFSPGLIELQANDQIGATSSMIMNGNSGSLQLDVSDNVGETASFSIKNLGCVWQFSPTGGTQIIRLQKTNGIAIVDSISFMGMVYDLDYSANYIPRSIPDVAWVLAQLGGSAIINTPEQAIASTIFFTSVADPTAPLNLNYQWTQVGKLVTARFNLNYANAGTAVQVCAIEFPADLPLPFYPTGFSNSADIALFGSGGIGIGTANEPTTFGQVWLTTLPGIIPYVSINMETPVNGTTMWATLTYFAA